MSGVPDWRTADLAALTTADLLELGWAAHDAMCRATLQRDDETRDLALARRKAAWRLWSRQVCRRVVLEGTIPEPPSAEDPA